MGSMGTEAASGIPTIDISTYLNTGDPAVRKAEADRFVQACHVHGAVGIVGHGVPVDRLRAAFAEAKRFFDLPRDDKMKAPHPDGIVPHRGYSGIGTEKCLIYTDEELKSMGGELSKVTEKALDFKEEYDIGSDEEKTHYNIWIPDELIPGFRTFTTEFYWELEHLSRRVLDALLTGLDVDEKAAEAYRGVHTGHQNGLRLLHYPSISESVAERQRVTWCPAHTDFTSFTFLFQDSTGGLEIEDRLNPGTYFPAGTDIEDRLWFTFGDFMEIFSNGYLPASRHRVQIPPAMPGSHITPERYSIPYFITPAADGVHEPQTTGKPGTMPQGPFKKTTTDEHVQWRMRYQYAQVPEKDRKDSVKE